MMMLPSLVNSKIILLYTNQTLIINFANKIFKISFISYTNKDFYKVLLLQ